MWNKMKGKKTYLTAIGGILIAVGSVLTGQMEIGTALKVAFEAALAMFIRNGIG